MLCLFAGHVGYLDPAVSSARIQAAWQQPVVGLASWYSEHDVGVNLLTANGEAFSDRALTAAMWGVPFDSCVQVTHLRTHEQVRVRVNDRGPHERFVLQGRLVDLSAAAFEKLADLREGLIPVQIELVAPSRCQAAPDQTEIAQSCCGHQRSG
jgi:rare lipoprotein A